MKTQQTKPVGALILTVTAAALAQPQLARGDETELRPGAWHAWLDSPGGKLPFDLELARSTDGVKGFIINGDSRIELPRIELQGNKISILIDHYDATLSGAVSAHGTRIDGRWRKRGRGDD